MTKQQLEWIRKQNWFISDHDILGRVVVVVWDQCSITQTMKQRDFTDFDKLTEWALPLTNCNN